MKNIATPLALAAVASLSLSLIANGAVNVAALTGTPEPATYMTMGLFLVGGLWVARRRNAQNAVNA